MTDPQTDRFALPLLQPGQAQKEMFHNEALAALDLLIQPAVEAVGVNTPPTAPRIGPILDRRRRADRCLGGQGEAPCGLDQRRLAIQRAGRGHGGVGRC